jgi:phytoene dehydrogenase-like protein
MPEPYEFVIIGSGMAGLTVGSLLARAGKTVCLLEAHEHPGGCAHSFRIGQYTFCAAVHYIFFCGEGEPVYNFLKKLGLEQAVQFCRLDPEGYDHFSCPSAGLHFRIPNGLDKWTERLVDRFPAERDKINGFFQLITGLIREIRELPSCLSWRTVLAAPLRFRRVLRYQNWTLQDLFDRFQLATEVQAILATQLGDLGLPPALVSLPIYAALVWSYGLGAYHPTKHFAHFIETVAAVIASSPGCAVEYEAEVSGFEFDGRQVRAVRTRDGRMFAGRTFIANMDPRACAALIGRDRFPGAFLKKVDYDYSVSSYTLYLGVRGIDLRDHGFGAWNVWHYPHLDLNRAYRAQSEDGNLSDPWLFLSTPSLFSHSDDPAARICPDGDQILEAVTVCRHEPFGSLRGADRRAYRRSKKEVAERILDVLEEHYVPGLRGHLVKKVAGTPATNVRYLRAPRGNIYGSALTPANVNLNRLSFRTPIANLFFTGASAGFPSIGATVSGGARLYTHLTGDPVNPGRDLAGLL